MGDAGVADAALTPASEADTGNTEVNTGNTESDTESDTGNTEKTAADWAREMSTLRETKPRPLDKAYGKNGPTPDQAAAHEAATTAWNAAYRKASVSQKLAQARENATEPKKTLAQLAQDAKDKVPGYLGRNTDGEIVYQDARGVRSILRNGVRTTESVAMRPTREGMQIAVEHKGEYLTAEEAEPKKTLAAPTTGAPKYAGEPGERPAPAESDPLFRQKNELRQLQNALDGDMAPQGRLWANEPATRAGYEQRVAQLEGEIAAAAQAEPRDSTTGTPAEPRQTPGETPANPRQNPGKPPAEPRDSDAPAQSAATSPERQAALNKLDAAVEQGQWGPIGSSLTDSRQIRRWLESGAITEAEADERISKATDTAKIHFEAKSLTEDDYRAHWDALMPAQRKQILKLTDHFSDADRVAMKWDNFSRASHLKFQKHIAADIVVAKRAAKAAGVAPDGKPTAQPALTREVADLKKRLFILTKLKGCLTS